MGDTMLELATNTLSTWFGFVMGFICGAIFVMGLFRH